MNTHTTRDLSRERRRLEAARDLLRRKSGQARNGRAPASSGHDAHLVDVASDTLEREIELSVVHGVHVER